MIRTGPRSPLIMNGAPERNMASRVVAAYAGNMIKGHSPCCSKHAEPFTPVKITSVVTPTDIMHRTTQISRKRLLGLLAPVSRLPVKEEEEKEDIKFAPLLNIFGAEDENQTKEKAATL
jgi:hypothetical protein